MYPKHGIAYSTEMKTRKWRGLWREERCEKAAWAVRCPLCQRRVPYRENTRRMFIQLMMLSSGHSAQLATWAPRKTRRHSARFFDLTHSQSPAYL